MIYLYLLLAYGLIALLVFFWGNHPTQHVSYKLTVSICWLHALTILVVGALVHFLVVIIKGR